MHRLLTWFLFVFSYSGYCNGYQRYDVEDDCGTGVVLDPTGENSAAIIRATKHTSYTFAMRCMIEIKAAHSDGLTASVREVGMRTIPAESKCLDFIEIIFVATETLCNKMLDLDEAIDFVTDTGRNSMRLIYYVDKQDIDNVTMTGFPGFQLTFTAFQRNPAAVPSGQKSNQFKCNNGRYIWDGLKCDGHNNCGDMSDESIDGDARCEAAKGNIFLYIFAGLLIMTFVSVVVAAFFARKKKRRRQQMFRMRRTTSATRIVEALSSA